MLLTADGEGHTAYMRGNSVDSAVNAYFLSGTVPADGTTCSASGMSLPAMMLRLPSMR